jgi:hypothetical protein
MKPRHLAMGAALLLAAGLVLFGDKTPDAGVAEPVERAARAPAPVAVASAPTTRPGVEPVILRLLPRAELMGESGADGTPLFGSQNWNPPPPPPVKASAMQAPPPPPAPTAPPLPFTLIGKSAGSGVYEVYLARGDQVFLVREKTTIDGTYRVDKIVPPMLTLTYLPLNQVQQLNIGVFD